MFFFLSWSGTTSKSAPNSLQFFCPIPIWDSQYLEFLMISFSPISLSQIYRLDVTPRRRPSFHLLNWTLLDPDPSSNITFFFSFWRGGPSRTIYSTAKGEEEEEEEFLLQSPFHRHLHFNWKCQSNELPTFIFPTRLPVGLSFSLSNNNSKSRLKSWIHI